MVVPGGQDFRPAFKQLAVLGSLFPDVPIVGLTATASRRTQNVITEVLGLKTPVKIIGNVDRPNIFIGKYRRGPSRLGIKSFDSVLRPIAEQLKVELTKFPITVIYLPLKWCGTAYNLFVRYWVIPSISLKVAQGFQKTGYLHNTMLLKLQG
ncbi:hypothetical protein OS493_024070 [Desmophyllum pertusum]|uniref:Uncharacterized protein n=1 Tax=Desmophyllum pertusum TaxID=174260 RepID=A0A9X0D2D1_9CNID|nr:hypothetical protein OS493_024070 [Desmophyllum pertusum]